MGERPDKIPQQTRRELTGERLSWEGWQVTIASENPRIAVIGLGHVGLPTAVGLADLGWEVLGIEDDAAKADRIRNGHLPFYEPGLESALKKQLSAKRLIVATDSTRAIQDSEVLFVCIGTPQRNDGSADLSQMEVVAQAIARHLNGYKLIVEKSTAPVRTAEQIKRTIRRYANGAIQFDIAVNPEFLREGSALHDFFGADRIVLGVESTRALEILVGIYQPLLDRLVSEGKASRDHVTERLVITDINTAELIKHAANAFLATKISFINMIAELCEASGGDVMEVARGIGLDPRIGPAFLSAGLGFGGYCLPKDLCALICIGEEHRVDMRLLHAVKDINSRRVEWVLSRLRQALWILQGKTVGVLGLAFKPMTDDVREATSLQIIAKLLAEGVSLRLHDPQAGENMKHRFPEIPGSVHYCSSAYEAAAGAHALVVVTEWAEYRDLDLAQIRDLMQARLLVDGRNLYDPSLVRSLGFEYMSVGRQ